jgi:Raf kinase inhibitor-like YbhB/YbcL family protein
VPDRRTPRRAAAVATAIGAVMALAVLAAACDSGDGRQLAPPNPNETASLLNPTTTTVPPSSAALGSGVPGEGVGQEGLTLRAPWEDEGNIDPRFACTDGAAGTGVSPALSWSGVPAGATNLALVVTDLSADGFVHWIVVGIDPEITGTAEGLAPAGAVQGKNGFGAIGWGGPCPPAGSGSHEYLVQLYALNKDLALTDGFDAQPAIDAIEAASMATVSLVGRYPPEGTSGATGGGAIAPAPTAATTVPATVGHGPPPT